MDPKVVFWSGALLDLSLVVVFALRGVACIRRGDVARHRRSMLTAVSLVLLFLVSYVFKLWLLGREELAVWSEMSRRTLQLHELCVLVMLVAGGIALQRARRMRRTRNVTQVLEDPPAPSRVALLHRAAGRTAVVGAVLGLLSAGFVLAGMYERM